jgi:hypothetical protein
MHKCVMENVSNTMQRKSIEMVKSEKKKAGHNIYFI